MGLFPEPKFRIFINFFPLSVDRKHIEYVWLNTVVWWASGESSPSNQIDDGRLPTLHKANFFYTQKTLKQKFSEKSIIYRFKYSKINSRQAK
jgi:hypothetical protein